MIDFRLEGDRVVLELDGIEATLIENLASQVDAMLASRTPTADRAPSMPDDPALARLLPDLLRDDPDGARELRGLTEPSLVAVKREQLRLVSASIAEPGELDAATEMAWMRALTDVRLTIATRLGIEVDGDAGSDTTETDRSLQAVFHWLGAVQDDLVLLLDARDAATSADDDIDAEDRA